MKKLSATWKNSQNFKSEDSNFDIIITFTGKQLIQTCLNSPDPNDASSPHSHDDQRMSAQGFEEPELTYVPAEDNKVREIPAWLVV